VLKSNDEFISGMWVKFAYIDGILFEDCSRKEYKTAVDIKIKLANNKAGDLRTETSSWMDISEFGLKLRKVVDSDGDPVFGMLVVLFLLSKAVYSMVFVCLRF